jgi:hypothetical protein
MTDNLESFFIFFSYIYISGGTNFNNVHVYQDGVKCGDQPLLLALDLDLYFFFSRHRSRFETTTGSQGNPSVR